MKRCVLTTLLMVLAMNANAGWFDLSENKGRCGLGVNMGFVGWNTRYGDFGWGPSINVNGVYLDFLSGGPAHEHSKVRQGEGHLFNDSTAFLANVGYQLPIFPWLRVMPLVGYCQTDAGVTDVSKTYGQHFGYAVTNSYHPYIVTPGTRRHYINFGVGVFVQPVQWLEVYAVGSLHALYGGISINLGAFAKHKN